MECRVGMERRSAIRKESKDSPIVKKYSISRFDLSISVSSKFFVYPLNALQSLFS